MCQHPPAFQFYANDFMDTTQLQSTLAERGMEKVKQHINSAIAELNEMAKRIAA